MNDFLSFLTGLCNEPTVSGGQYAPHVLHESGAFAPIRDGFDRIYADDLQNLYFEKDCPVASSPRVLIDAHFDEIGLIVSKVLQNGFLSAVTAGGPDERTLAGAPVTVHGREDCFGVIASIPPHLRDLIKADSVTEADHYLIDTGCSAEETGLFRVGDRISFARHAELLPGEGFSACGLDNKYCCAIALWSLARIPAEQLTCHVTVVLSSREETGAIGAKAAARKYPYDAAICMDVGFASSNRCDAANLIRRGHGPSVSYSAALDRNLTGYIVQVAKETGIPLQIIAENPAPGTNAETIQYHAGIPSCLISLPLSNMHTGAEVVDLKDARICEDLLHQLFTSPFPDYLLRKEGQS